jgi:hypothetical protein
MGQQQLLPLHVRGGTISCSTDSGNVEVIRFLHEGVTASAAPPQLLASSTSQHPPADWAAEAQKGVWLDLRSPAAGVYVEVPLGEVSMSHTAIPRPERRAGPQLIQGFLPAAAHHTHRSVAQPSWLRPVSSCAGWRPRTAAASQACPATSSSCWWSWRPRGPTQSSCRCCQTTARPHSSLPGAHRVLPIRRLVGAARCLYTCMSHKALLAEACYS